MTRPPKGSGSAKAASRAGRALKTKVKTAGGRKPSSTRWLERQLNDPYVHRARAEGRRGRAAYKLIELDDGLRFLVPGARVVDLGAAPGGWTQVAVARVNALRSGKGEAGRVIGVDLQAMDPVPGAELIRLDFLDDEAGPAIRKLLDGEADAVLSDMAAPATGHRRTDRARVMALADAAARFAVDVLAKGGVCIVKMLRGGADAELLTFLKRHFAKVAHVKPPASRKESSEIYLVATGFRGDAVLTPPGPPLRER